MTPHDTDPFATLRPDPVAVFDPFKTLRPFPDVRAALRARAAAGRDSWRETTGQEWPHRTGFRWLAVLLSSWWDPAARG
jgi:hypothetical protein